MDLFFDLNFYFNFEKYKVDIYISGHEHNIQYIERKISNDYTFHQFIIENSSENRVNNLKFHIHMFYNKDNFS